MMHFDFPSRRGSTVVFAITAFLVGCDTVPTVDEATAPAISALLQAEQLLNDNKLDEAESQFAKVESLLPSVLNPTKPYNDRRNEILAKAHFGIGTVAAKKNDCDRAAGYMKSSIMGVLRAAAERYATIPQRIEVGRKFIVISSCQIKTGETITEVGRQFIDDYNWILEQERLKAQWARDSIPAAAANTGNPPQGTLSTTPRYQAPLQPATPRAPDNVGNRFQKVYWGSATNCAKYALDQKRQGRLWFSFTNVCPKSIFASYKFNSGYYRMALEANQKDISWNTASPADPGKITYHACYQFGPKGERVNTDSSDRCYYTAE